MPRPNRHRDLAALPEAPPRPAARTIGGLHFVPTVTAGPYAVLFPGQDPLVVTGPLADRPREGWVSYRPRR
jgi:hypothetical protein